MHKKPTAPEDEVPIVNLRKLPISQSSELAISKDNGYYISGLDTSNGLLTICKTDPQGLYLSKVTVQEGYRPFIVKMMVLQDSSVAILYSKDENFKRFDFTLACCNDSVVIWKVSLDSMYARDFIQCRDNMIMVSGSVPYAGGKCQLYFISLEGAISTRSIIQTEYITGIGYLYEKENGNLLITANLYDYAGDGKDAYGLIHTDKAGSILHELMIDTVSRTGPVVTVEKPILLNSL